MLDKRYDKNYFRKISSLPNWKLDGACMAKVIYDIFKPKSVIDFGCGTGRIIENLYDFNCEVKGLEGSLKEVSDFMSNKIRNFVLQGDVTEDIIPLKKYDLSICTEVAEHVFPEGSIHLVNNLCSHSNTVLFASAPPEQKSPSHINLHPLNYWEKLFLVHGFVIDKCLTEEYKQKLRQHNVKQIYINNGVIFKRIKKNYGIIVRSVGERTEKLCLESVRLFTEPLIVRNIHPHAKANITMYEMMLKYSKDWWLSVDADVVLVKDWFLKMDKLVEGCENKLGSIPGDYEFILNKIHNRGIRTYNGKYIQQCLDNIRNNYDKVVFNLFPEDAARKEIKHSFKNLILKKDIFLGFHGCEQYFTHIYNAYIRYAIRTKNSSDEKVLLRNFRKPINPDHNDRIMAIKGWDDGWNNTDLIKTKDFTNYIKIKPDKKPCELSLKEFYEKYERCAEGIQ